MNEGFQRRHLVVMSAAAAVLMITMGMRQTVGLYITPVMDSTHLAYASMSFALAVGQLMWGAAQPVFGAMAERHGAQRVLVIGALMLAAGFALTPFMGSEWGVVLTLGVLTAAGAGAGSFAVIIGQVIPQTLEAGNRHFTMDHSCVTGKIKGIYNYRR